jgi:hypothetical protein
MFELTGMYPGETAYVVGKGPSLGNLRAEHIGEGIVIALNQAVAVVERLDIPNVIYSLQKDGCGLKGVHDECLKRDGMDWMIRPERATLIVQAPGYSGNCLPDYEPRLIVRPKADLGFIYAETMAVRMGIAIAKLMRCRRIVMTCCDSLVNGKLETFDVHKNRSYLTSARHHYGHSKAAVMQELAGIEHSFVIPKMREAIHG